MKKFLKILLIVAALFLLFASYCGYHMCRMLSLDPGINLSGDNFGDPESALNMLLGSKDLSGGIACGTLRSHLRADYFESLDYLKTGFSAEYFFQTYDINEKRLKSEITQRYEKDSLEGELRSKWGKGTIITQYIKEDSCYRVSKEIKAESADSVVVVDFDKPLGTSHLYVGKRKNGKVTECIVYKLKDGLCDSVVFESRIEFDPASGNLLSSFDKTRNAYFEGSLYEIKNVYSDKKSFDSLGRLVELNMDGRIFRYEYSSSDTANYSVKILNKSGIKVGFYKRKFKGNRETVQYGTDRHEEEINRYFENGKMVKETSKTFDFYRSVMFRVKMFNANGDIVRDSSFYEDAYFPGLRTDSYADVIKWEYGENGKPQKYVQFEERFIRPLPFVFFPLLSGSRNEIVRYVFAYDDAGQLISITDESEDENMALRYGFPLDMLRIVYSKGKLENIEECQEPYDPYKHLKSRRPKKQEKQETPKDSLE
jgi:hypothetical protein